VAAAEAAEEEEDEDAPSPELRTYTWRYSVPALLLGGQSLEDAEHDIKDNLLNYDGACADASVALCRYACTCACTCVCVCEKV